MLCSFWVLGFVVFYTFTVLTSIKTNINMCSTMTIKLILYSTRFNSKTTQNNYIFIIYIPIIIVTLEGIMKVSGEAYFYIMFRAMRQC